MGEMIYSRSEKRAMERAKEKYVKDLMRGGYDKFRDITEEAHTKSTLMRHSSKPPEKVYLNSSFIVQVYDCPTSWGQTKRVMIRWNDARPEIGWAMLQRIKNDIFGPERVALEVFPAESNKQDVANMYWLWLLPEGFDCPIEWKRKESQTKDDSNG